MRGIWVDDMLEAASPVIQVVTTGVDWPAIAAVISTGVVGVAGIGATLWQARRNWSHEDERAMRAEKIRIYASCLGDLYKCLEAARHWESAQDSPERKNAVREYGTALTKAVNSLSVLALRGPELIGPLVNDVIAKFKHYLKIGDQPCTDALAALAFVVTSIIRVSGVQVVIKMP